MARIHSPDEQGKISSFIFSRLWFLIVAVVALIIASAFFVSLAVGTIETGVSHLHLESARRAAAVISNSIASQIRQEEQLANDIALGKQSPNDLLSIFLRDNPGFERVSLIDTGGKETVRLDRFSIVGKDTLSDFSYNAGFLLAASSSQEYLSPVSFSPRAEPVMSIVVPIRSLRGEFLGAISADLNLKFMWDLMAGIRVGDHGKAYVVDDKGILIADPDSSLVLQRLDLSKRPIVRRIIGGENLVTGLDSADRYKNLNGVDMFAAGIRINPYDWAVITEEPLADAFLASHRALFAGIILSAASAILLFILLFALNRLLSLNRFLDRERAHTISIISNLADGIIEYSNNGEILLVNSEAESLLGIKDSEVKGKIAASPLYFREEKYASFKKVFETDEAPDSHPHVPESDVITKEISITTPAERTLRVISLPVTAPDGVVLSRLKIIRDVTRDRLLEKMKSEFISIAAHQLRTPLSAIKWSLRTVLDGDLGGLNLQQLDFLRKSYETNERMIQLVSDLLDVSRIEEGRFGYSFKEGDFVEFLVNAINDFAPKFEERRLKVTMKKPKEPQKIFFDPEKMNLAISNLLANAINYTKEGGSIAVSVTRKPPYLEIDIADTGIGIPESQKKRLFAKFFRADNVIRMQTQGSGLGLFIVKNIVTSHGGTIWIESQENKGTHVVFTIPLSPRMIPRKEGSVAEFADFARSV